MRISTYYLTRRMSAYRGTTPDYMAMAPVSQQHPLSVQVKFRVKMLSIFLLQLLVVGAVVAVFRFVPSAKRCANDDFTARPSCSRASPPRCCCSCSFSAAQSALFVGIGVVADTNVGVLNCGFAIYCVLAMLVLAGVRRP
ncbi:hypothetical protein PINS_up018196 [Pythium insidiosum]|nr:hypothetical protein PINS_up018196 [Pythium insidiosum]